jgi:hypothetical protein
MRATQSDLRARRVLATQWAVVLGPPILWTLRFMGNYALMPLACSHGALPLLHAMNGVALAALLLLGWLAWRIWRGTDAAAAGSDDLARRTRFMGLFGMMAAALFFVVIVAEGLANFMIDPCLTAGPLVPH